MKLTIVITSLKSIVSKLTVWQIVSTLYVALCFIGLTIQSSLIIQLYLKYQVSSSISIFIPDIIEASSLSICIRYTDIFDYFRYNKVKNKKWLPPDDADSIRKYQHELRVSDIFDFTPKSDSIIDRVRFRNDTLYLLHDFEGKDAYHYFSVKKYLYLEYVCYIVTPLYNVNIPHRSLSETPVGSGSVYRIVFTDELDKSNLVKLSLHSSNIPRRSLMVIPVTSRLEKDARKEDFNDIKAFRTTIETDRLEYPYETNCFNYDNRHNNETSNEMKCIQLCVEKKTVSTLGMMRFNVIINHTSPHHMISYIDLKNKTLARIVSDIKSDCVKGSCWRPSCKYRFHLTTIHSMRPGKKLLFEHITPTTSSVKISYNPAFPLVEFLTYTFSIVSTWTGASVMTLNPGKLLRLLRNRKCGKNNRTKAFEKHPAQRISNITRLHLIQMRQQNRQQFENTTFYPSLNNTLRVA